MLQVTDLEIENRLKLDNPWWGEQADISNRFKPMPRRAYFNGFLKLVTQSNLNRAVVLLGPRRVGKTVMVYHTIHHLIKNGTNPNQILYVSLETPLYTGLALESLLNKFISLWKHTADSKLYVFYDEIQYLPEWEVHLKSLVDTYPNAHIAVTGSAAAALKVKSRESGAGRFTDFLLPPLTFAEFIRFIKVENELVEINEETITILDIEKLNKYFSDYINWGGYPETALIDDARENVERFIKADVIEKVLLRDLPTLYGISNIQEINRLFTVLAYNTANEISFEELSQSSGVSKNTLKRYLEYLEAAFLLRRVQRVDNNSKQFRRTTKFKVYLTNPTIRAALFGPTNNENATFGHLAETALYDQWLHSYQIDDIYYARWNTGEVDVVKIDRAIQKPKSCIEIKWSNKPVSDRRLLKNVIYFSEKNKIPGELIVTSKSLFDTYKVNNKEIKIYPTAAYTYAVSQGIVDYELPFRLVDKAMD